MSREKPNRQRNQWVTPRAIRDWQQGETPLPTGLNSAHASDFLDNILSQLRLADGVEEGKLRESWRKVAGSFVAGQTEVVSLKHGVLMLRVLQPAMRFHLEQSRGELLRQVQAEVGKKNVREIRLTTG
jgi:predicted nucleic acid-binding Zn ribbon protein